MFTSNSYHLKVDWFSSTSLHISAFKICFKKDQAYAKNGATFSPYCFIKP